MIAATAEGTFNKLYEVHMNSKAFSLYHANEHRRMTVRTDRWLLSQEVCEQIVYKISSKIKILDTYCAAGSECYRGTVSRRKSGT